jgi:immune inhibitor A
MRGFCLLLSLWWIQIVGADDFFCAGFASEFAGVGMSGRVAKFAQSRTEGTRRAVVIFARFRGETSGWATVPEWSQQIFDADRPGSFSHFYDDMSFGKLRVRGEVAEGVYESKDPAASYLATDPAGFGNYGRFALEILERADAEIDFSRFDDDGPDGIPGSGDDDGVVDALFLAIAYAPGNFFIGRATGVGGLGFEGDFITDDAGGEGERVRIMPARGTIQQGRNFVETVGSMCHEYGHVLGLPDLYNTDFLQLEGGSPEEDSAGIGAWGLMGWGTLGWNGTDGPNSFSAFCRMKLGWSPVVEISQRQQRVELGDVGNGGKIVQVPVTYREFFLLEYRRAANFYDRHIPAEGLLIWHVTWEPGSEMRPPHWMADLECADGRWREAGYPIGEEADPLLGGDNLDFWAHDGEYTRQHEGNMGDGTDPFDGVRFTAFTPETNPSSHSADGRTSIRVENIRFEDGRFFVDVQTAPLLIDLAEIVLQDENGDSTAVSGEELTLRVWLANRGGLNATDVEVRLRTADPLVEIVRAETAFGDLDVGEETFGAGSGFPRLRFGDGFVGVHMAELYLDVFANGGLVGSRTVEIAAISPRQTIGSVGIRESEGNGDGLAQVGEFVHLEIELEVERPDLLGFLEFSLHPLREDLIAIGTHRVRFGVREERVISEQSPEFLLPASLEMGESILFEFEARSEFGSWLDTLAIELHPGADRTPPRVLGFGYRPLKEGLRIVLPETNVLDGSGLKGGRVLVYSYPDSVELTSIPLVWQENQFGEIWATAESGTFLLRIEVEDVAGNVGLGDWQVVSLIEGSQAFPGIAGNWEGIGPFDSGQVASPHKIAFAPGNPEVVYAADSHALWRSWDGGDSWERTGLMRGKNVEAIFVDAIDPMCVYVNLQVFFSESDIMVSRDGGMTWRFLDAGSAAALIAADPVRSGRIYARSERGLILSGDGGATWEAPGIVESEFLLIHPRYSRVIYTGQLKIWEKTTSEPGFLSVSVDGGVSWDRIDLDLGFNRLVIDPLVEGGLYGVQGNGLWHSVDFGAQWIYLDELPSRQGGAIWQLKIYDEGPDAWLLWNSESVQRSRDVGKRWEEVAFPEMMGDFSVYLHPRNPDGMFIHGLRDQKLWRTRDGGNSWGVSVAELTSSPVGTLHFDRRGVLFAGSGRRHTNGEAQSGCFSSADQGRTWEWQADGIDWSQRYISYVPVVESLFRDPANSLFMLAYVGLSWRKVGDFSFYLNGPWYFQSVDGGGAWRELRVMKGYPRISQVIFSGDSRREGEYYIAGGAVSVFRSQDAGQTWEGLDDRRSSALWGVSGFALDPGMSGVLYTAVRDTVWVSREDGGDWAYYGQVGNGPTIEQLAFHPLDSQRFYAVTREGIFRRGETAGDWVQLAGLNSQGPVQLRLRFHPFDPERMFLTTGLELLATADGGKTWSSIGEGLAGYPWFTDVAVDPFDPDMLYASTSWGIFRLDLSAGVTAIEGEESLPGDFSLEPNFPNPFNPRTSIVYELPRPVRVELSVYNIAGQRVKRLVDKMQAAGRYRVVWDGSDDRGRSVGSGVYFCRLRADDKVLIQRMALVK